jgi:hypothetical protein
MFFVRLWMHGGPYLGNDGYQYLSIASNFLDGEFAKTSVPHFDAERSHSAIPAPLTTFPFGYSLMLALVSTVGVPLLWAGAVISSLALVATVAYVQYISTFFSLPLISRYFLYIWIGGNFATYRVSTEIRSEALFTLLTTLAIVFLLRSFKFQQINKDYIRSLILANVLIGLAYWTRYAGLFLYAATMAYFSIHWLRTRDKFYFSGLLCLVIPSLIIGAGLIRNTILVGTWKGGNTFSVDNPLIDIVQKFVSSAGQMILGRGGISDLTVLQPVLLVSFVGLFYMVMRFVLIDRTQLRHKQQLSFIVSFLSVYCAAMIYAGTSTPITFSMRMFYPILPSIGIFAALLISNLDNKVRDQRQQTFLVALLILFSVSYSGINLRKVFIDRGGSCHTTVSELLTSDGSSERDVYAWIQANTTQEDVLIANIGQASNYVLGMNTVSLVGSTYSSIVWNQTNLRTVSSDFSADYLLAYAEDFCSASNEVADALKSATGTDANGREWLHLVMENQDVSLYRILR